MPTPAELQEMKTLLDEAVEKKLNQYESKIKDQAAQIASLLLRQDEVNKALAEAERKFLRELSRQNSNADQLVLIRGNPNRTQDGQDNAPIYMERSKAIMFGRLALAIKGTNENHPGYMSDPSQRALEKLYEECGMDTKAAQLVSDDTVGGVLCPDVLYREVIRLVLAYGVARRNCRVVPLTSGSDNLFPKRSGGLTVYWPGEGGTITDSKVTWGAVKLIAKKMATLTYISSEINEDALADIGAMVAEEIAWAIAYTEDQCVFNGDGTSSYGGITGLLNAAAAGSVDTITGNTVWTSGTLAELTKFPGMIADYADDPMNLAWYINRNGYYQYMIRVALAAGGVTAEEARSTAFGANRRFLSYPVEFCNALLRVPTSTAKVGVFGNLRASTILGDRRRLEVARSTEVAFASDLIALRATQRWDFQVHDKGTASLCGGYACIKMAT